jgi:hypothetical protein
LPTGFPDCSEFTHRFPDRSEQSGTFGRLFRSPGRTLHGSSLSKYFCPNAILFSSSPFLQYSQTPSEHRFQKQQNRLFPFGSVTFLIRFSTAHDYIRPIAHHYVSPFGSKTPRRSSNSSCL